LRVTTTSGFFLFGIVVSVTTDTYGLAGMVRPTFA
jgi:hypothetical protein